GDHLVIMAGFALAAGFVEVLVLLFHRHVRDTFIWAGSDVVWMSPVSYLALFAIPALILYAVARALPGRRTLALTIFTGAFLSIASILELLAGPRIMLPALLLLAFGGAVWIARSGMAAGPARMTTARSAVLAMAAILV